MKNYAWLVFCLLLIPAQASALRCGKRLVDIGDSPAKVAQICGEPDSVSSYERPVVVQQGQYSQYSQDPTYGQDQYSQVQIFIHVETWTYNFGPKRFIKELIFEDGALRQINNLGYGD
ncbi:MAG: DUF2845 domain-containing protein [Methylococcales bacterium]